MRVRERVNRKTILSRQRYILSGVDFWLKFHEDPKTRHIDVQIVYHHVETEGWCACERESEQENNIISSAVYF